MIASAVTHMNFIIAGARPRHASSIWMGTSSLARKNLPSHDTEHRQRACCLAISPRLSQPLPL
jgi:hypothetical protein